MAKNQIVKFKDVSSGDIIETFVTQVKSCSDSPRYAYRSEEIPYYLTVVDKTEEHIYVFSSLTEDVRCIDSFNCLLYLSDLQPTRPYWSAYTSMKHNKSWTYNTNVSAWFEDA